MGKPLMLQAGDDTRIERLKKAIGAGTKVEVVRTALTLLEEQVDRNERIRRWQAAAKLVARSSQEVLREFQPHSRLKRP